MVALLRHGDNWALPRGALIETLILSGTIRHSVLGVFTEEQTPLSYQQSQCGALVTKATAFWHRGGIWTDGWTLTRKSKMVSLGKIFLFIFVKLDNWKISIGNNPKLTWTYY